MPPQLRQAFPWIILAVSAGAIVWAVSFSTIEEADFAYQNGDDCKTLDPGRATGEPEHNVLDMLFEGLLRPMPEGPVNEQTNLQDMVVRPGVSEMPEISEDGRTYRFRIRENMRWSDGSPITSEDFVWSWRRTLHPGNAGEYAQQLYYIVGAEEYNTLKISVGDRVEAELRDRPEKPDPSQPFPRGTVVQGILRSMHPPSPTDVAENSEAANEKTLSAIADWQRDRVCSIEVKPLVDGKVDWDAPGEIRHYSCNPGAVAFDGDVKSTHQILIDFDDFGGVETPDQRTLIVRLKEPTPFFSYLTGFYPLYPVNRHCIEKHGSPGWTRSENMVCNGPYRLKFRRIRDRIRVVKNEHYWNAENVHLKTIDAFSLKSQTTALNMYLKGQIDWAYDLPLSVMEQIQARPDAKVSVALRVYFYRLNTAYPPLDDARVRRALNLAVNKKQIVEEVRRGGELVAHSVVPPVLPGYDSPAGEAYNPELARQLLTEAGYPGGQGIPTLTILYNTSESHRAIAEVIQQHWQNNLNVKAALENMEWGTYLDKIYNKDYVIGRGGWIGDYPDPNTFLEMWTTDNSHNSTNWSNRHFDELMHQSQAATGAHRMQLLREAEEVFLREMPVLPIYFYTTTYLVNPEFEGLECNVMNEHPMQLIRRKDN